MVRGGPIEETAVEEMFNEETMKRKFHFGHEHVEVREDLFCA